MNLVLGERDRQTHATRSSRSTAVRCRANQRGASIHVDAQGRTVVTVTAPDMYRLVLAPGVEDHQLTVVAEAARARGVRLHVRMTHAGMSDGPDDGGR